MIFGGEISKSVIAFASISLTVLITACVSSQPTPSPTPVVTVTSIPVVPNLPNAQVLRLGRSGYPDVLDPQKLSTGTEIEVVRLCYEGLLSIDAKSNIGPGSADTYRLAPDGKSMVFHIREGLVRADGTPLNASDFEYALKREVDPRITGKQYTDIVNDVAGATALADDEGQRLSDTDLAKLYSAYGVRADDGKRELTVTFTQPIGYWQYVAFTWVTFSPDKKRVDAAPDNWWTKAEGHNCYGPFNIKSIEDGKRITYEANPTYWRGRPKLDRIETTYVADDLQRLEAYKKGEFDEIDITTTTLAQAQSDPVLSQELVRYPAARTIILAFNNARKPFDDKNVRVAFSQAFDREGWVRDVLKGIGTPSTRWIPPGVPAAQPIKIANYDPQTAIDTLIKNGYGSSDGKKIDCAKLGSVKLTFAASPVNTERFQFLSANFNRVFGCPITLEPLDSTVYVGLTRDAKTAPQISRQGWIENYPHPKDWLSTFWKCNGFARRFGYCNKDLDLQLNKADQTTDFDQSLKEYMKAEDMVLADAPAIFANHSENVYLTKPYILGLRDNLSSFDFEWAGEWGPIWTYQIDLAKVPESYPRK